MLHMDTRDVLQPNSYSWGPHVGRPLPSLERTPVSHTPGGHTSAFPQSDTTLRTADVLGHPRWIEPLTPNQPNILIDEGVQPWPKSTFSDESEIVQASAKGHPNYSQYTLNPYENLNYLSSLEYFGHKNPHNTLNTNQHLDHPNRYQQDTFLHPDHPLERGSDWTQYGELFHHTPVALSLRPQAISVGNLF